MPHTPAPLAAAFVRILREWLTPAQIAAIVRANADEQDPMICHSHDFCDPNQAMLDAFEETQGRECNLHSDDDTELVNAAWAIAKACEFGNTFAPGQWVKFAAPLDESESTCRMQIIELRGDRALVSDDMHSDMTITPTSVYLLSELVPA